MRNFFKRLITGGVFGIMVFGSLFAGSITFFIFFLLLLVFALLEFHKLIENEGLEVHKFSFLAFSIFLFILLFGYSHGYLPISWLSSVMLFPLIIMVMELYRKKADPFNNIVWSFYGIIYVAVPVSLLNFLVFPRGVGVNIYEPGIVAGLFILIMVNDTAAYLIGVPLGRHRLFESVSPQKSWEGTIGGVLAVLIAALFMEQLFSLLDTKEWFAIALIVALFGIYGDLVESLLKRKAGIKDSGRLLPGHGGVLDRIDAWLFAIPAVWVYLNFIIDKL